ncbi:hypothetical protein HUJ04_000511 [Dendroctonus ponderosae]|nr:hypothetical protein HUJ04_000511 [Dendroctonus ponderosae]
MAFLRTVNRCSVSKKYGLLIDSLNSGFGGKIDANQSVRKSTAAATSLLQDKSVQAPKDPLDLSFEDARAAFKSKTNWELLRALVVYQMCSYETIVTNNMRVSD